MSFHVSYSITIAVSCPRLVAVRVLSDRGGVAGTTDGQPAVGRVQAQGAGEVTQTAPGQDRSQGTTAILTTVDGQVKGTTIDRLHCKNLLINHSCFV